MPRRRRDPLAEALAGLTPRAAGPTTTEQGLGWEHQQQRLRLLRTTPEGWPCPWCHQPMYPKTDPASLHADHSQPRSQGGALADRLMHARCNQQRGNGVTTGLGTRRPARTTPRRQATPASLEVGPDQPERLVVLLCGPPGAGKSTAAQVGAQVLGLQVFDRDDPAWAALGERGFRDALADLGADPAARAVVIRAGASSSARAAAASVVRATHTYLLTGERRALEQRVARRGREGMRGELLGVRAWLDRHDVADGVQLWSGWSAVLERAATRTAPAVPASASAQVRGQVGRGGQGQPRSLPGATRQW